MVATLTSILSLIQGEEVAKRQVRFLSHETVFSLRSRRGRAFNPSMDAALAAATDQNR
jgi:hypothetical protein